VRARRWLAYALLCGVSACGARNTLDTTKPLKTVSGDDVAQICATSQDDLNRDVSAADQCKLISVMLAIATGGTTDADIQSTCSSLYTACIGGGTSSDCNIGDPTTCSSSATIGQLFDCVNDDITVLQQLIPGLPACSALTTASTIPPGTQPPSCTTLLAECPDIISPV